MKWIDLHNPYTRSSRTAANQLRDADERDHVARTITGSTCSGQFFCWEQTLTVRNVPFENGRVGGGILLLF